MNILGAIFPIESFFPKENDGTSLFDRWKSSLPFCRSCIVQGDADQCFRSLLFQAALSFANIGKRVNFYAPSSLTSIPTLIQSFIPTFLDVTQLELIEFVYLPTLSEVHKHMTRSAADVYVIDGYLEFPFGNADDRYRIAAESAVLRDTHEYLREKYSKPNILLLCSCACSDSEKNVFFDSAINVEMLETGDYSLAFSSFSTVSNHCQIEFRIDQNQILPLSINMIK